MRSAAETTPQSARFGALGALVAAIGLMLIAHGEPAWPGLAWPQPILLPAVVILYVVAEATQIHIEGREHTLSVSSSDLPLVLGLFFLSPWWLLAARLVSATAIFVRDRRSVTKSAFNLCLYTLEIGIGSTLFRAFPIDHRGTIVSDWVYAFLVVIVLTVVSTVVFTLAMRSLGTHVGIAEFLSIWVSASLSAVLGTAIALMAVVVLDAQLAGLVLLAVLITVAALAYRAYRRLLRRHTDLGELFAFTQTIGAAKTLDEVVETLLQRAKEMLHAERVTLGPAPEPGDDLPMTDGEPVLVPRGATEPRLRGWLQRMQLREAMLVTLHDGRRPVGVVQVANRIGRTSSFDSADLDLLQTLTAHAEAVWRSGRLLEQLRYDAHHDGLTDLGNRSFFHHQLGAHLADPRWAASAGPSAAVLLLDLDRFKEVNDTLGHPVGDELLRLVAQRLQANVPADSVVARLGGDEFAVLVPPGEGGLEVATRIRATMTVPFAVQDTFLEVGASIGVALVPEDGTRASTLLQHADVAMYAAKRLQHGVSRYSADDDRSSVHRLAMAGELRGALADGQVLMHLQPQASLATGRLTSFEALARWHHPRRGTVMPDEFVPLAEQTGLIGQITHIAMDQSLAACRAWLSTAPDVGVSVNLSPRQLTDVDLPSAVARLLERHGVPARLLTLEITEGSIMIDPPAAEAALRQLRDLGVRLSVDDFGTGHSALAYLQRLSLDELKIDKSFVMAMHSDRSALAIVRTVVDLAHTLDLSVVAEGVETEDSRQLLADMGCDIMQGYLLSAALPPAEVGPWRERHDGPALTTAT